MTTFEEELDAHGSIIFTNRGRSMLPLLRQNRDVLVIDKRGPERLKKYDAVLFKRDTGQYILHRILRVENGGYYIAGDNNISGEFVREDQILGVLRSVRRGNRTINVTDFGYRCYVRLFRPVHRALIRPRNYIYQILYRCGRFVKRKILRIK